MENEPYSNLFRDELRHFGIAEDEIALIRNKEGVIVARVPFFGGTAVLKCFERADFRREIENYEILNSCGVPTLKVLGKTGASILLEDVEASPDLRLGEESDFSDPSVIKAIAKWYRTLHENGAEYVKKHGAGMYEEWDAVTPENVKAIGSSFGLSGNAGLRAIEENFDKLRKMMDEAPRTLAYNDFYYTNMVVRKDKTEAFMFDYNLLGKGCAASDLINATYWFSEENRKLFYSVYGPADEKLMLLEKACSPVVSLCSALSRGIFPDWAREAAEELDGVPKLIRQLGL